MQPGTMDIKTMVVAPLRVIHKYCWYESVNLEISLFTKINLRTISQLIIPNIFDLIITILHQPKLFQVVLGC
jgi:hypothetical protein